LIRDMVLRKAEEVLHVGNSGGGAAETRATYQSLSMA